MSYRRNFSLIELLVVVAIFTIMLSLLTPSLNRFIRLSKQIKCQSQLKDIGIWAFSFSEDHHGVLPVNKSLSNNGYSGSEFEGQLHDHWYENIDSYRPNEKNGTGLHCPEAEVLEPRWDLIHRNDFDYSLNQYLGARYRSNHTAPIVPRQIHLSERKFWFSDGKAAFSTLGGIYIGQGIDLHTNEPWMWKPYFSSQENPGFGRGHSFNSSNFLFGDGHVESLIETEVKERMSWPTEFDIQPFTGRGMIVDAYKN